VRSFSKVVLYSAMARTAHISLPVLLIRNSPEGRFVLKPFPAGAPRNEVRLDVRD
jgi:hypothetical protein